MSPVVAVVPSLASIPTPSPVAFSPNLSRELVLPKKLQVDMAVLVLTGRSNFAQRNAIRKTWKGSRNNVFFIAGAHACPIPAAHVKKYSCVKDPEKGEPMEVILAKHEENIKVEQYKLDEEVAKFRDLVLVDMVDSYRGLPKKLKLGYKWLIENTNAKWFMKVDDDFYLRVDAADRFLKKLTPTKMVVGKIARSWNVPRKGKWAELDYKKNKYPPFPLGSCGHAVSRDVGEYIFRSDQFEYQGEDVSVGIWLDNRPDFRPVKFYHTTNFVNNGRCSTRQNIVIGHNLDLKKMIRCKAYD